VTEVVLVSRPTYGLTASRFADTLDSDDPAQVRRLVEIDEVPDGMKVWARRQLDRAGRRKA
jgi:hypothetical protein